MMLMKRFHDELAVTRRHHREHLRSAHGWPKKPVECPCDLQAGRFRKRDAYDCGNTLCCVCHYYKWLRGGGHEPTRKERLAEIAMREGVNDFMAMREEVMRSVLSCLP